MNQHLLPKTEFSALLEAANTEPSPESHAKLWFAIADRILGDWDGMSLGSYVKELSPGQAALVCAAKFYRNARHDFLSSITSSRIPPLALAALETLRATEYFELLRAVEAVFPGKTFPEYAEDMMAAYRKLPAGYFDRIAEKFVSGKGMNRPIADYVFDYVVAHPQEFRSAS